LRQSRYFVFELKVGAFQPEHAGQLGFYLAAVNGTMRTPVEGPSIGVLLCQSRNGPTVEFALETINQAIGVSPYHVTRELPAGGSALPMAAACTPGSAWSRDNNCCAKAFVFSGSSG